MMKIVLKLDFVDDKTKQKAMQKVSGISGLESIVLDTKDKKLTVIGDIDPVDVVAKLRKLCRTEIISVGPAKEPEKKKEEPKKEDDKKKEDQAQFIKAYQAYYNQNLQQYYQQRPYYPHYRTVEEDPNGCVIC